MVKPQANAVRVLCFVFQVYFGQKVGLKTPNPYDPSCGRLKREYGVMGKAEGWVGVSRLGF